MKRGVLSAWRDDMQCKNAGVGHSSAGNDQLGQDQYNTRHFFFIVLLRIRFMVSGSFSKNFAARLSA